jgi:acetyl esterase/lipase
MRRLLFLAVFVSAEVARAGSFTTFTAIEYESVDSKPILMDLRVPDDDVLHPVILYLHSGAWVTGDRFGGPVIREASRGYAVASIDYRLAPQYTWPAQIEDCKTAIRWLRANAARYRLDPNRIAVFGTSAGGHLAAMLGTTSNHPEFEAMELGNPQFSSAVSAVVDFYGPTDLLQLQDQSLHCYPGLDGNEYYMPPSILLGCPIQECKDKAATANPITYVSAGDPPFLIMQGMLDCLVPWRQSQILYDALKQNGVDATLVLLPTAQHSDRQFDQPKHQQTVDDFLDRTLRGPKRRRAVR